MTIVNFKYYKAVGPEAELMLTHIRHRLKEIDSAIEALKTKFGATRALKNNRGQVIGLVFDKEPAPRTGLNLSVNQYNEIIGRPVGSTSAGRAISKQFKIPGFNTAEFVIDFFAAGRWITDPKNSFPAQETEVLIAEDAILLCIPTTEEMPYTPNKDFLKEIDVEEFLKLSRTGQ